MIPRICGRYRLKYFFFGVSLIFLLDFFGLFTHMFELDYYRLFQYPMYGDVLKYAHQVRFHQEVEVKPINFYNYSFLKPCENKCMEENTPVSPKLTILIKSSMKNFNRRDAIRKSWGFEKRFSDVIIRAVFIVGVGDNRELQKHIELEAEQYNDIIQSNFIDTYFNNTIKTMMGFKWAVTYCPSSKFYMFVDDDFFISIKNVLRFLKSPFKYPEYLEEADETLRKLSRRLNQSDLKNASENAKLLLEINQALAKGLISSNQKKHFHNLESFVIKGPNEYLRERKSREKREISYSEFPPDGKLFSGYVFNSSPHRHKSSRWYTPLSEYPYHMWPPYVTAGAFILSREALFEMYYTSYYTRHFRFDDIYLGLLAIKSKIEPLHNKEFYFYKATYSGPHSYRYVIASHGYDDSQEMIKVWNECRAAGHA